LSREAKTSTKTMFRSPNYPSAESELRLGKSAKPNVARVTRAAHTARSLRDSAPWLLVVAVALVCFAASTQLHAAMPILDRGDSLVNTAQHANNPLEAVATLIATALFHAALAGFAVAAVLAVSKQFSRVVSGVVAGLPLTTAPGLILLASANEVAPDYAIRAATAGMWVAAGSALFALGFAYLCARMSLRWTTVTCLVSSVLIGWLFLAWPASYPEALVMTLLICAAVRWLLPQQGGEILSASSNASPALAVSMKTTALLTATLVGGVSLASAWMPAGVTGLFVALPIIGATLAYRTQANSGTAATRRMLVGYVDGCVSKIVFCFIFAYLLRKYGVGISAMAAISLCLASSALMLAWTQRKSSAVATPVHSEMQPNTIGLQDHTVTI
jgi:hypothetical protein